MTAHGHAQEAVEVVAHRGASADQPEHSLAAYRHAIHLGADAIECDVRLTRDGTLVCVHDRRIDRTSTGRGVISTLTLAELERFEFGRGHGSPGRRPTPPGVVLGDGEAPEQEDGRVLTLDRLLEYVTSHPGRIRLAIETKHPTRYSQRVEAALLASLRRFGLLVGDRPAEHSGRPAVRVMSFSPAALRRVEAAAPHLPTVQLVRQFTGWPRTLEVRSAVTAVGPPVALLRRNPSFVAQAHAMGAEVHVWTVNDPEDVEYVLSLAVDAVITDRPGALLRRLGRGGADGGARARNAGPPPSVGPSDVPPPRRRGP